MAGSSSGKVEITLPSDRELVLTRVFDAPRHLLYDAWTKPELVRRWWCCMEGFDMPVCDIDLRVGGAWRFVMRGHGSEHGFKGEYRELAAPARIVMTQFYDVPPFDTQESVVTMTFEERGGKTYFTSHTLYATKEGRDGHVASGMEYGTNLALDRMEEITRELAAAEVARASHPGERTGARP